MANPLIIYDDGSTNIFHAAVPRVGDARRNILEALGMFYLSPGRTQGRFIRRGESANIAVLQRSWEGGGGLRAILTDSKSSTGTNDEWIATIIGQYNNNRDKRTLLPAVAVMSTSEDMFDVKYIGRDNHLPASRGWVYSRLGDIRIDTSTGGFSRVISSGTEQIFDDHGRINVGGIVGYVAQTGTSIIKTGGGRNVEIISSDNPLFLPKPPQTAFPSVAKRWQTYPIVSAQGDFLGSYGRPTTGMLDITIPDVANSWIVEQWEPFREHVSKGGIFAYAVDWENDPGNVAFCFAAGNVPSPVVKAGGYGTVSLKAGVAHL